MQSIWETYLLSATVSCLHVCSNKKIKLLENVRKNCDSIVCIDWTNFSYFYLEHAWVSLLKMASIHLKSVLSLIVICFLSWPIHMKSIPSDEPSDLPKRTGLLDIRPKFGGYGQGLRQMTQITNFFGGLLGGTSGKPFIRCSCSKFRTFFVFSVIFTGRKSARLQWFPLK